MPSWLDRGALIIVDAPGNGSMVRRQMGYSCTVPKDSLAESAYFSSRISHSTASLSKRPSSYKSESALHQRGPLGRTVLEH